MEPGSEVRRLRDWRRRRLLSIRGLAVAAGVAKRTVEQAEAGRTTPHGTTARKLSSALGVAPEQVAEFRRAMGLSEHTREHASKEVQ